MSELQVGQINSTDGSTAITTGADGYVSFAKTQIGGRRNLIINGAMQVAQRGDSTSISSGGYYGPDRFRTAAQRGELTWDVEQSSDAPSGFANSLKITVNTPESALSASDQFNIQYRMEGQDLQQLKKGTASAESVTLSFWVKCSLTGTWTASLLDTDNDRIILKNFTIDSANTWEHKTFTFVGDTVGALTNDNNDSLRFRVYLDGGTTYTSGTVTEDTWQTQVTANLIEQATGFMTTDAATFQITGVQLEVGTVATPFEHISYGEQLALCQRYFSRFGSDSADESSVGMGYAYSSSDVRCFFQYPVTMRARPTVTESGVNIVHKGSSANVSLNNSLDRGLNGLRIIFDADSGTPFTAGDAVMTRLLSSTASHISFDAEL